VIILSIVIEFITSKKITEPLTAVMRRLNEIASGKLDGAPLKTNLKDETGQLVSALNKLTKNMQGLLHEVQYVSEEINDNSTTLKFSADEVKSGAEQTSVTMEELAAGSEKQSTYATDLSEKLAIFVSTFQETNENSERMKRTS